jgi:hypothetical protein
MKHLLFPLLPLLAFAMNTPTVEYRFDECYWLDGANGVVGDVKENINSEHATSSYLAEIGDDGSNPTPCHYGMFLHQENSSNNSGEATDKVIAEDTTTGNVGNTFSVSLWLHPRSSAFSNWVAFVTKTDEATWDNGWGIVNPTNNQSTTLRFYINEWNGNSDNKNGVKVDYDLGTLDLSHWYHIVGTYDQTTLRLYVDGKEVKSISANATITNSSEQLRIGGDYWGTPDHDIDEVKIWNVALSATDVNTTYQNEKDGKNYDGTDRTCDPCIASIAAHKWEMVSIPTDLRSNTLTVTDVFGDEMNGTYDTDWRVYRRDYNTSSNNSWYTYLGSNDTLEFGKGYWLGSKNASSWSENGTTAVDYNATCVSGQSSTECVEIVLKSVTLNFGDPDNDPDDSSGPYRYNLTSFTGKKPVNWADCRIVVEDTVYTPSESASDDNNFTDKQIWLYNAEGDDYITCDDATPGGCKLVPYKGFWIELRGKTKGKTVKLLIPKE